MSGEAPVLHCPSCRAVVGATVPWRPFCSERCKMVDLGAWLLGHYRVPAQDDDALEEGLPRPADDDDPAE